MDYTSDDAITISIDLDNAPTTRDAVLSSTFLAAVIGPAGTGKTFTSFQAFLVRAMQRPAAPPDANGRRVRYTKLIVVRNTYSDLNGSTIPTAREALENIGNAIGTAHFRYGNEPTATITGRLEDGTYLDFMIDFVAVDRPESMKKLLGRSFTYGLVDEVSEIPEHVILRLITRVGRYPPANLGGAEDRKIVMVTNGPRTNHFLYGWANGAKTDVFESVGAMLEGNREAFRLYRNPPALLRPANEEEARDPKKWRPNPLAENIRNLPGGYGYYYPMLATDDNSIKAFVEGDWVPHQDGRIVFPEFSEQLHVIKRESFFLPPAARIGMSFDFGGHPVCLFWYEDPQGRAIVFDEFMMVGGIDDLMRAHVWPAYLQTYGRPVLDWATGDPSGLSLGQGFSASPYDILMSDPYNLPMEPPMMGNRIEPRLNSMHAALKNLATGVPAFGVTSNCRILIQSLGQTYIYKNKKNGAEGTRDEPTKSNVDFCSDVADACCYGVQYRSIRSAVELPTMPTTRRQIKYRARYGRYV